MRPKIRQANRGWQKDGSLFDGIFVSHGRQHSGINKRQLETLLAVSLIRHCTPPAHFDAIWLHINHVSLGSCLGRICTTSGDFQVGYLHVNCQRSETYEIKKRQNIKNVTTIKIVKKTVVKQLYDCFTGTGTDPAGGRPVRTKSRQNESLFRSNGTHVFVLLGFRSDGISFQRDRALRRVAYWL